MLYLVTELTVANCRGQAVLEPHTITVNAGSTPRFHADGTGKPRDVLFAARAFIPLVRVS